MCKRDIPQLTTDQMVEVDRLMINDFHIELIQMMENAGRNLARVARFRFLDGKPVGKEVIILVGSGNNGGGAMVCARHLHNWGTKVRVFLTKSNKAFTSIPAHQLDIIQRMNVSIARAENVTRVGEVDLIVDGLIGYNLAGSPRGTAADLIRWANAKNAPILALDIPSGLDAETGDVLNPAIQAAATMTLALPKRGLCVPGVESYVGELYLADISVPPALYQKEPLCVKIGYLFAEEEIVRIR
jgi:NAD(P)H-hydrate epimerase